MQRSILAAIAVAAATSASPAVVERQQSGGSGPYGPASYYTESSLGSHTIYMPQNAGNTKLPVVVWGNGGCGSDGLANVLLLEQWASYGYLAIASGGPGQQGGTTAQMMTDSINWAISNAGKGKYVNVDATKIMAAGFSCGGVEAYGQIWDSRVTTIGIFSSGLLDNTTAARYYNKPILYCLGGSGDIAYSNGERDFHALPSNTPSWKGNLPVGHGGTLFDANGGKFGKAGLNWMQWLFRNDQSAKGYLTGGYSSDGWQVETHALDKLTPANPGGGSTTTTTTTGGGSSPTSTTTTTTTAASPTSTGCVSPLYGQCGGADWAGCKACASGSTCKYSNDWYSQCL